MLCFFKNMWAVLDAKCYCCFNLSVIGTLHSTIQVTTDTTQSPKYCFSVFCRTCWLVMSSLIISGTFDYFLLVLLIVFVTKVLYTFTCSERVKEGTNTLSFKLYKILKNWNQYAICEISYKIVTSYFFLWYHRPSLETFINFSSFCYNNAIFELQSLHDLKILATKQHFVANTFQGPCTRKLIN